MKKILGILFFTILLSGSANAQCYKDSIGNTYCPPPGGSLMIDWSGTPICALGGCTKDALGNIICSSVQMGYVTRDALGTVKCTGRCVKASRNLCQRM